VFNKQRKVFIKENSNEENSQNCKLNERIDKLFITNKYWNTKNLIQKLNASLQKRVK
jgi:hypothetical protein